MNNRFLLPFSSSRSSVQYRYCPRWTKTRRRAATSRAFLDHLRLPHSLLLLGTPMDVLFLALLFLRPPATRTLQIPPTQPLRPVNRPLRSRPAHTELGPPSTVGSKSAIFATVAHGELFTSARPVLFTSARRVQETVAGTPTVSTSSTQMPAAGSRKKTRESLVEADPKSRALKLAIAVVRPPRGQNRL